MPQPKSANHHPFLIWLVVRTPLKILVNWDYYPQCMGTKNMFQTRSRARKAPGVFIVFLQQNVLFRLVQQLSASLCFTNLASSFSMTSGVQVWRLQFHTYWIILATTTSLRWIHLSPHQSLHFSVKIGKKTNVFRRPTIVGRSAACQRFLTTDVSERAASLCFGDSLGNILF